MLATLIFVVVDMMTGHDVTVLAAVKPDDTKNVKIIAYSGYTS